jgi:adenosylhomocysteine nucleosidase
MIVIQICSNEEWKATKELSKTNQILTYPYGEYFYTNVMEYECIFYHSGATKTLSSGACQYAIDHWNPKVLFVLGTCGGVDHKVNKFDVIVVEQTAQYDIKPMKRKESIFHEIITFDHSWINFEEIPYPILRGFIATADQSVTSENYQILKDQEVIAADWETASIAKICSINGIKCCVIRGVSDVAHTKESVDVHSQHEDYKRNTSMIMQKLISSYLPCFISNVKNI